jgi:hypothetical protein
VTGTLRARSHPIRSLAFSGLLVAGLLAAGVRPALAGGADQLTVTLTGSGTGTVVGPGSHINCARTGGITSGQCDWQYSNASYPTVDLTVTAAIGTAYCDNNACYAEAATTVIHLGSGAAQLYSGFFGLQNRYIAVLKSGAGSGSVTSTDGNLNCPAGCHQTAEVAYTYGDSVTLHAVAASGSVFNGWTDSWAGGCAGQGATCTFTMTDTDTESSTTAAFKLKAVPTPAPTHTPAPGHTAAPGQTQPRGTTAPAATSAPADPGASGVAPTNDANATPPGAGPSADPAATANAPSTDPVAVAPTATPGSLDTGWIAFLLLLVLVLGVSVGGAIAFVAMRRRAPPPAT